MDDRYDNLVNLIEKLIIEENVSEFWVGNYGNFDGLSAKAVRCLKEKHPDIQINLVIPYLTSDIHKVHQPIFKKHNRLIGTCKKAY